jgi:hypothetical protein
LSEIRSGDEIRQRNIAIMGEDLGDLFTALSADFLWMCIRWEQFTKLYVEKPSRLVVLNRSAPFFFWVIQQVLWEDTLLGIARLAGPTKSAGKDNLSLKRVVPFLTDGGLRSRVEDSLAVLKSKADFAFEFRNRHIAHRDLGLSLGNSPKPLPSARVTDVDEALDALAAVLNEIENHYSRGTTTAYKHPSLLHDAEELLFLLKAGIRREDIRRQKAEQGMDDPEDWDDDAPEA